MRYDRTWVFAACFLLPGLLLAQGGGLKEGEAVPGGAVAVFDGIPIPTAAFQDEMVQRFLRPGGDGYKVLETLEQETLIRLELRRRGLDVTDDEVALKVRALGDQVRSQSGKSLEDTLRESKVSMATFVSKTRGVVALEKLARSEFGVPADKPIENHHLNLWLKQAQTNAKYERDPSKLRPDAVSSIEGEPILKSAFVHTMLMTLDPAEIRRIAETLMQEVLAERMLSANRLALTAAEVDNEWIYRKKEFEDDPLHKGVPYEDIIRQQTGLQVEAFKKTRGFRVNAALALLARSMFSPAQVESAFQTHQSLYGPRYHARHILLRASDHPNLKDKVRSLKEGEELANFILEKHREGTKFEDLARQYSEDHATRFQGGVVPSFTPSRNNYEPDLVRAVMTLKPYEVSAPVRGSSGWHIMRLDKVDPTPPLSLVDADLRRVLASEAFKDQFKAAKVGIDIQP